MAWEPATRHASLDTFSTNTRPRAILVYRPVRLAQTRRDVRHAVLTPWALRQLAKRAMPTARPAVRPLATATRLRLQCALRDTVSRRLRPRSAERATCTVMPAAATCRERVTVTPHALRDTFSTRPPTPVQNARRHIQPTVPPVQWQEHARRVLGHTH